MRRYTFVSVALCAFFVSLPVRSQSVSGRLTTSFYAYQQYDSLERKSYHLRGYQLAEFTVGEGNISFTTYLQGSTDLAGGIEGEPRLRAYNLYLDVKRIADVADVRLGRQIVFAGVSRGPLDGLSLKLTPYHDVTVQAYGGMITPTDGSLKLMKLKDNYLYGTQVTTGLIPSTRLSLSYMNLHRLPDPYLAVRVDTTAPGGFRQFEFQGVSDAEQLIGADASVTFGQGTFFYGRFEYDINNAKPLWGQFSATVQVAGKLSLLGNVTYRQPRLPYNSIFSVFDQRSNLEVSAGAGYNFTPATQAFLRFGTVSYGSGEKASSRVTAGASASFGSISYTKDFGYAGEMDLISAQGLYPVIERLVLVTGGVSWGQYTLDPDASGAQKETVLTALGGIRYQPLPALSFDVQGQVLSNHVYLSDARIFIRASYWFFSKLGS